MAGWGKIAAGIVLLIIGVILSGLSNSIINQCNTFSGQFDSFLDSQNQSTCMVGSFLIIVGIFFAIVGLVLILVGAVSKGKKKKIDSTDLPQQTSQLKSFCRFCGRSVFHKGEFCPHCGKNLKSVADTIKKCEACSASMSEDSEYCANCGSKF